MTGNCDPVADCPSMLITPQVATQLYAMSFSGDGHFFASAGAGGYLYIFNSTDFSVMQTFYRDSADFLSIRISDDGNSIIAGRENGVVDVYVRNCLGCS